MDVGVHGSMLEPEFGFLDAARAVASARLGAYEPDIGLPPDGEPWRDWRKVWRERIPELARVARHLDLSIPSMCLGVLWQYSLASTNETERTTGVAIVRESLSWAVELGASAILLPVGQPVGVSNQLARERLVLSLRQCAPLAEQLRVTLAIENLAQPFLWEAVDFTETLNQVNSLWCRVYFDTGNHLLTGQPIKSALMQLRRETARIHLKDSIPVKRHVNMPGFAKGRFDVWKERTAVHLGTGELDFGQLRSVLKTIKYDGPLILEVPVRSETREGRLRECRTNVLAAHRLLGVQPSSAQESSGL